MNTHHDILKTERGNWFQGVTMFRPNLMEIEESKPRYNRGRKPKPSKRIVDKSPDNIKWWRSN